MIQDPLTARVSRRTVLRGTALAGISAFLAACTGTKATPSPSAASEAPASVAPNATPAPPTAPPTPPAITGPLMFANWPAYIDLAGAAGEAGAYAPGSSPSLEEFKKKYNVSVDYEEKISDNSSFVQTITPALVAGLSTGWDLIVITDWMAAKVVTNGWAEKIEHTFVPNCVANLRDPLRNQPWDPGNDYHYPWQSGMTGVGYNAKDPQGEQDRGAHQDRRPVEPAGQQGDLPVRGARHVRPRAAQAGHQPGPGDRHRRQPAGGPR